MLRMRKVAHVVGLVAVAALGGCKTDLGELTRFLACDKKGRCADGYHCARLDLGAVCLTESEFKERCGSEESCNSRDDNCDGVTDEGFDGIGDVCAVGTGECTAYGLMICAAEGSAMACSAIAGEPVDELCNDRDDDCDDRTDEDFPSIGERCDIGVGACAAVGFSVCSPMRDAVICTASPGFPADESCNDRDDDCDGDTDEDVDGTTLMRPCYDGPWERANVAACRFGTETCTTGFWSDCVGQVLPEDELCDGLDNDCDGFADEGIGPIVTGLATGVCKPTIADCVNGNPLVTLPGVDPTAESCNNLDDNCDGQTDETFIVLSTTCAVGEGECTASGVFRCSEDGSATICDAVAGNPGAEVCDELDNNCDGATDEIFAELGEACSVGVGVCLQIGLRVCRSDGFGTQCGAESLEPTSETCNGLDDDCDGVIDNGISDCCVPGAIRPCGNDLGECTVGAQTCTPERVWGACSGQGPVADTCNGLDDDCDGEADEELSGCCGTSGTTIPCGVNRGACAAGVQTCGADGIWSACSGVLPTLERCDGSDNDCDGKSDEDFSNLNESCSVGRGACAATGVRVCTQDGLGTICGAVTGTPTTEICNFVDDDCDGEVDDGLVTYTGTDIGECQQGIERCIAGVMVSVQDRVDASDEVCDGRDNDCDGIADDEAPNCCAPGQVRTCGLSVGICTVGSQSCGPDFRWSACSGTTPAAERCDGIDNDCNGVADDPWTLQLDTSCIVGSGLCARLGRWVCNPDFSPSGEGERAGVMCTATAGDPSTESCNGLDDDCDGQIDEISDLPPVVAGSDIGECQPSISVCRRGQMVEVRAARTGSPETCDSRDNDCSGTPDDDIPAVSCYTGPVGTEDVGICTGGYTNCVGGTLYCIGQRLPSPETCDGFDNNCDGVVDGWRDSDGHAVSLAQPCYSGPQGTLGVGECRNGTSQCQSYVGQIAGVPVRGVPVICETARDVCYAGWWGECVGEVGPVSEVCGDAADSDCDGRPDGITFLEDFEDNCAMPEATVTSDVPLECVETPADAVDPTRTPSGQRSLRVALTYTDRNLEAVVSWPIDKCSESAKGSVRIQLRESFVPSSGLLVHPIFFGLRSRLLIFADGAGTHVIVEEDTSGTQVPIPVSFVTGAWHEIAWESSGAWISYRIDGTTIYEGETASPALGVFLRAAVDSIIGARLNILIDDVQFSSP